jgi:PAS domain S-box-containing protein
MAPHEPKTRRNPGAAAQDAGPYAGPAVSLIAQPVRPSDLLPTLHQHAIDRTKGQCSLLFQHNPRNGALHATSGFRLETLRSDPWLPAADEAALVSGAFERREAVLVNDLARVMPDLAGRIGTRSALLAPLTRGDERIGLLVIGLAGPPADGWTDTVTEVGDAFLVALELLHLRQSEELQRDVRTLVADFSASLSATLNLSAGLDLFCAGTNMLFGADRTSVWIHDRRARSLVLQASSETVHAARGTRVAVDDVSAPAAAAMRRTRAEIATASAEEVTATVTVPLRGTRRALGTIVFDGVRVQPGGELDLLDRADELGRQLASAIENMQLLDDLIRSRRELENTFDSITSLVAVTDRRGQLTHVNRAFAARLGRSRDDLIDRPLADCVGTELASWIAELEAGGAAPADSPASREIVDPTLNGPFMVTVTDLVNPDRERVGCVIVLGDLTPHTRLEAEREELRKRLTQTEKLAALGQFVAGIAHELNNPLQGVLGHLELLRVTGAFPKQIRREVQTVYREADRAAKIVRNLLVFAGSRRLARRSVSVNAVLQKVLALRAPACRALDIELVRHYDDKLPRVKSDPLLLHQVFLNMVMNAEHAIAAGGRGTGRIEVTTAVAPRRDRVVATVRDTGTGIAEETLSRIFEPFYTTKEVGKGTGLGLAIAYGIVQEHGGHIVAANHPDGGAVFTVELPTAASPARDGA